MARRRKRLSKRMLFTWFFLVSLIFFFTPESLTSHLQLSFARVFRIPLGVGHSISLSAHRGSGPEEVVSRRKYNQLRNHLENIRQKLYAEHKKSEQLAGLRMRLPLDGANLITADVITARVGAEQSKFVINRGSGDGLGKGQFALADNSVIGVISQVGSSTATLRLLSDPESKVAVKIGRDQAGGLMHGLGANRARIELSEQKVPIGEYVFVRRKPGFLDVPIIAGEVVQCERDDQSPLMWNVEVETVCNLQGVGTVAVIVMDSG